MAEEKDRELDTELAEEFGMYKMLHMYSIIYGALTLFEEDGIYEHYLLKDKYDTKVESGQFKAREIAYHLMTEYRSGNTHEFIELYNYCWNILSPMLDEHENLKANPQ